MPLTGKCPCIVALREVLHTADFVLCDGPRSWWSARGRSTGYACPPGMAIGCQLASGAFKGVSGKAVSQRQANIPPPEFFAGDGAADAGGAHEPAVVVQRPGQGDLPAAGMQPGDDQAVGVVSGCSSRWRGPDVGGPAPWGAHDAGFRAAAGAVRRPGRFMEDPAGGAEAGSGRRLPARVTALFRLGPGPAGGCRRAGNRPPTEPQRSGPAAVSGAAPLVSRMHSHMDICSWWAILTARITVRTASRRHRPAQAIISRPPFRSLRFARAA